MHSNYKTQSTIPKSLSPDGVGMGSFSSFSRMFVRMPLYVGQWLRTKYMPSDGRLAPIRIPITHPAGRIVYTSLVCNASMKKLTPMCYSAQMFGIPIDDIPAELLDIYPDEANRGEYVSIALPSPHFFLGRWIDNTDMWQLNSEDTTRFNSILLQEMWQDVEKYWQDYQHNHFITQPDRVPVFYDCLLDFCELYNIDIDAIDSFHRAYRRLKKKRKDTSAPVEAVSDPSCECTNNCAIDT